MAKSVNALDSKPSVARLESSILSIRIALQAPMAEWRGNGLLIQEAWVRFLLGVL